MVRNHEGPAVRGSHLVLRVGRFPPHTHPFAHTFSKVKSLPVSPRCLKAQDTCLPLWETSVRTGSHGAPTVYRHLSLGVSTGAPSLTLPPSGRPLHSATFPIFIPLFQGDTSPHHKLVQHSHRPTGKFTQSLISITFSPDVRLCS